MTDLVSAVLDIFGSTTMYSSAIRLGGFIAFAALGELIAERAGTINISVEGYALAGAFAGAVAYDITGSTWIGLIIGIVGGFLVSLVQANMSHRLTADQFVVGLTINIFILGLVGFLNSSLNPVARRATVLEIPILSDIPLIGPALFGQPWPTYLLYVAIPLTGWLLYRTRWGLEVRSVGENPQASDVSGIEVNKRRRQAIYFGGALAGLAGSFLTLGLVGSFEPSIVSGRGFIAIAAVYFGGWRLGGVVLGALVFGFADAFRLAVPVLGYNLNAQMLAALPHVLTLGVMVVASRRVTPPAALAQPFIRGLR